MTFQALAPIHKEPTLSPLFTVPVPAGRAIAIEQQSEFIDIEEYIRNGARSVGYLRVIGDSMIESRIEDGDLLTIEPADSAKAGDVVVVEINGEYTVKRLSQHSHGLYLVPANDRYPIRKIHRYDQFRVLAIVKSVIHRFQRF